MKKHLELMACLCSSFIDTAQNSLPAVYEIKTDTAEDYIKPGDSYWQMPEERSATLTIDEVSKPPLADRIHNNTCATNGINVYRFRYHIKNDMDHEATMVIHDEPAYVYLHIKNLAKQMGSYNNRC